MKIVRVAARATRAATAGLRCTTARAVRGPRSSVTGSADSPGTPQLGRQLVGRAEPIVRVLGQRLEHDRLQVEGDAAVELPRGRGGLVHDLVDQLEPVVTFKDRAQRQQLVQGRAEGIDVAPAVRDATEPFGGDVTQGPDHVLGMR